MIVRLWLSTKVLGRICMIEFFIELAVPRSVYCSTDMFWYINIARHITWHSSHRPKLDKWIKIDTKDEFIWGRGRHMITNVQTQGWQVVQLLFRWGIRWWRHKRVPYVCFGLDWYNYTPSTKTRKFAIYFCYWKWYNYAYEVYIYIYIYIYIYGYVCAWKTYVILEESRHSLLFLFCTQKTDRCNWYWGT